MTKPFARIVSAITAVSFMALPVHAQGFPNLKDLGFPAPSKTQDDSTGKKVVAGGAGCAVGGAAGYFGTKALDKVLRKNGYKGKEVEQAAILVAGVGCVVGGAAAVNIIKNMDEKSKEAQAEAWTQAQTQANAEPVSWQGPEGSGYQGEVSIENPETMPDGQQCATRKDYVKAAAGEATAYTRMCKNEFGIYESVET